MKEKIQQYIKNKKIIAANNGIIEVLESRMSGIKDTWPTGEVRSSGNHETFEEMLHRKDRYTLENKQLKIYNDSVESELMVQIEFGLLSEYDFKVLEMIIFNDIEFEDVAKTLKRSCESVERQYYRLMRKMK